MRRYFNIYTLLIAGIVLLIGVMLFIIFGLSKQEEKKATYVNPNNETVSQGEIVTSDDNSSSSFVATLKNANEDNDKIYAELSTDKISQLVLLYDSKLPLLYQKLKSNDLTSNDYESIKLDTKENALATLKRLENHQIYVILLFNVKQNQGGAMSNDQLICNEKYSTSIKNNQNNSLGCIPYTIQISAYEK